MPKNHIPSCPYCHTPMQRLYLRPYDSETKKRSYVGVAWYCPNHICNHILRDD